MDDTLLACRGLVKRYGALTAVNRLDLNVARGEILGIAGPNGAGKTTLFDAISGIVRPDEGSVTLDGVRVDGLPPWQIYRAGLARTFQLNAGFDSLTVAETMRFSATLARGGATRALWSRSRDTREDIERTLDFVGLSAQLDRPTAVLPILDRKRLMIASAIVSNPRLLMLDEPVGGLNATEIEEMITLVGQLVSSGVTIIVIEHVMAFLVRLASRIVVLHHGEVIFDGQPRGLVADPTVVSVYLGEKAARRLQGVVDRPGGLTS